MSAHLFGKPLSDYLNFTRNFLIFIATVGIVRLLLTLVGIPPHIVRYFSLTGLGFIFVVYFAVKTYNRKFGSYQHLLALYFICAVLINLLVILGILISAATARPSLYHTLEWLEDYSSPGRHVLLHLVFGVGIFPLVYFLIGSVVLYLTKKFSAHDEE